MDRNTIRSVSIITDCLDPNARMRQEARVATLFPGTHISFCGVSHPLEIAFNVVDAVDAALGACCDHAGGVIIANGAKRDGTKENGARFGYTRLGVGEKLVTIVATIDGITLSLLKKVWIRPFDVYFLDVDRVMQLCGLPPRVARAQFRSYEIAPAAARLLCDGADLSSAQVTNLLSVPDTVAWIDNFGNAKTTMLPIEHPEIHVGSFADITASSAHFSRLPIVWTLDDLKEFETGLVIGSSGLGTPNTRFFEIMKKMGRAAEELGLHIGMPITITPHRE